MARDLYTDGENSLAHVGLGYFGGKAMLVPFLVYQYLLKYDGNSHVDTVEYLAGWGLGVATKMFGETTPCGGLGDWGLGTCDPPGTPGPVCNVGQVDGGDGCCYPGSVPIFTTPVNPNIGSGGQCFLDCTAAGGSEHDCLAQCTTGTGVNKTVLGSTVLGSLFAAPTSIASGLPDISTYLPLILIAGVFLLLRK
jgi:hypothetical protein